MILDEIVFHNFGVFRGRQKVELSPPSEAKPIVLVGGLNGNGKTTLLRAIELALYGPLSRSIKESSESYHEHLRKWINRNVPPSDGAAVELAFRIMADGKPRSYRVCRSWRTRNSGVTESLDVFVDDTIDQVLADTWRDHVERLIPSRLSQLFFFDGERIEALADPEASSALLRAAVDSLLGVDLINQLAVDLRVLERRKGKATKGEGERRQIEDLEGALRELESRRQDLFQQHGALAKDHRWAEEQYAKAESRFRQAGGDLVARRQLLEREQAELAASQQTTRAQLSETAAGALPLLLVNDLLCEVLAQGQREDKATRNAVIAATLEDRDSKLLKLLKAKRAARDVVRAAEGFLKDDRLHRATEAQVDGYLGLDPGGLVRCEALLGEQFAAEQEKAVRLVGDASRIASALEETERKLEMVPDADSVTGLLDDLERARKQKTEVECGLDKAKLELADIEKQKAALSAQLDVLLQADLDNKDVLRLVKHSDRVRQTLDRFKARLVAQSLAHLKTLILQSYQQLLRKHSLISDLRIDPDTFALELWNGTGSPLPAERLSAGERQLLAVSMLWGLGRASGRSLPVVIDTPLGRLDSAHRIHLVERYFPAASHQVILLSTDEEIDNVYFDRIKSRVGRTYRLDYDDASSGSTIVPGYFW